MFVWFRLTGFESRSPQVRLLRLLKHWKGIYLILMTLGRAYHQVRNLAVLIALLVTIFALLGIQLFGGGFTPAVGYSSEPCDEVIGCADSTLLPLPRMHFDYFMPAALTTFVVFTGEWSEALQTARAINPTAATVFFLT